MYTASENETLLMITVHYVNSTDLDTYTVHLHLDLKDGAYEYVCINYVGIKR